MPLRPMLSQERNLSLQPAVLAMVTVVVVLLVVVVVVVGALLRLTFTGARVGSAGVGAPTGYAGESGNWRT